MMSPKNGNGTEARERLASLRARLAEQGLDGFLVPRADEHQGEYVPARAERLKWLTGFDGSAGMAIVLMDRAALFVDGRYTLQARQQVDADLYEVRHVTQAPAADWLAQELAADARIGFDPWLHTPNQIESLEKGAKKAGAALTSVPANPIDAIWPDQPPPPAAPFSPHPIEYAGKESRDKRNEIGEALAKERLDAAILTLPDSIAWLLNIRGSDVPHTPMPLSFAILFADGRVALFAQPEKITQGLREHLGDEIEIHPPETLEEALEALAGKAVQADPSAVPVWFFQRLEAVGARIERSQDPCQLPKACKNPVEIQGTRQAHLRDGVALTRFLHWLSSNATRGAVTELSAAERLEAFRRESSLLRDLSFDTISGTGSNGAIVHYRVTPESSRPLEEGTLYLVDSGGQYPDGTTDVTRTVAIGKPTADMRAHFTLVLKGHIALATARFPAGTTGSQLDSFARRALWEAGLDYDHGTGHGVGSYLSVHEGPQRISKMPNQVALRPGMIVSNEPGYYKAGSYGIRIENLVAVTALEPAREDHLELLGFETLTLAPIDRTLVDPQMLTEEEIAWLDAYHRRVFDALGPEVEPATREWLAEVTAPIRA